MSAPPMRFGFISKLARNRLRPILRTVALRISRVYSVRKNVSVDPSVHIGVGSILSASNKLTIGAGTYIGKGCTVQVNGSIGRGVLIANSVGVIGRLDHDFRHIGLPVRFTPWIGDTDYPYSAHVSNVIIEDDVWIGYGAIILSRVRIGRGAIVAAGSVVREDIEAYAIVAGNPAQTVGRRFKEHEITEHEAGVNNYWKRSRS